jgi:hypothetical protein
MREKPPAQEQGETGGKTGKNRVQNNGNRRKYRERDYVRL